MQDQTQTLLLDEHNHPIPGAKLTQHTAQSHNPFFKPLPGQGACSAIMANWFEAGKNNAGSPAQASQAFHGSLQNSLALVPQQKAYLTAYKEFTDLSTEHRKAQATSSKAQDAVLASKAKYDGMAALARSRDPHLQARYDQLEQQKAGLLPNSPEHTNIVQEQNQINGKAMGQKLTPAEQQQATRHMEQFKKDKHELLMCRAREDELQKQAKQASDKLVECMAPGMKLGQDSTHTMQGAQDFGQTVAAAVSEQPGFYRISLRKGTEHSHTIGIENLGNGQFKFMDPNSGEFRLADAHALKQVLANNAQQMNYHQDADHYVIQQLRS